MTAGRRVGGAAVFVPLALACQLGAASASAQATETCVLLPSPESDIPADVRDAAQSALAAELRARSLVVLTARDAQLRMMGQPMEHCAAIDCAPEVNRFLGTSMAVLLELTWVRGHVTAVHVALVGLSADRSVGGQADVGRGASALEAAVQAAWGAAWDRWEADRQGQLTVTSTPDGAFVELDGGPIGRTPVRRLVASGIHSLQVTLEGYASEVREITIDRHEERSVELELRSLTATEEATAEPGDPTPAPAPSEGADEPHWANWLLGGSLIVASGILLIRPLDALARGGLNVAGPTETPRYIAFDAPIDGTLIGLAAACLVGGVAIFVVQPIRARARIEVGAASLRVTGSF